MGNLNILGIIPPAGGEVKVVWIGGCGGGLDGGEAKVVWIGGGGAGLYGGEAMGSHGEGGEGFASLQREVADGEKVILAPGGRFFFKLSKDIDSSIFAIICRISCSSN